MQSIYSTIPADWATSQIVSKNNNDNNSLFQRLRQTYNVYRKLKKNSFIQFNKMSTSQGLFYA